MCTPRAHLLPQSGTRVVPQDLRAALVEKVRLRMGRRLLSRARLEQHGRNVVPRQQRRQQQPRRSAADDADERTPPLVVVVVVVERVVRRRRREPRRRRQRRRNGDETTPTEVERPSETTTS